MVAVFFQKEFGTVRRTWEMALCLGLGVLLGLGIAAYRSFLPGQAALAQEKAKKGPDGIFSPPGSSDSGPVVPAPGEPPFKGKIGRTVSESVPYWPPQPAAPKGAPNVLYIVLDDVGFAALECYGSPVIKTPHLDKLAAGGVRYNNFHTTALCSPSRSCFLTGRNHHSNAMAGITEISTGYPGYNGRVPLSHGLLSEMLTPFGWAAFAIGKWHLTPVEEMGLAAARKWWPLGRGFERYYGFLGGDTDQYYPWLVYDNHFVQPPKTPEQGYHCVPDLVDKAKEFIADLKQGAPERPFFMYFCPGACHAPHHVPPDWIAKYNGKFDAGWDDYREKALANQIKMGICPPGTKLSPGDEFTPPWDKLTAEQKKVYAHEMEVYAAYLSYVDHSIGELVAFLEELGQLDNTLIIAVSDNGASPEGEMNGSPSEILWLNNIPQTVELAAKHLKEWGGPRTYPHYSWGWAWATNTPFRRWKEVVARGGTSDLCIVHWPKGIKEKNAIRQQFVHAIDLVPTTLDALNLKMPTSINGVAQAPIEGVSFATTFDYPKAPLPREAQYFEMLGSRAIQLDGWRAYVPGPSWPLGKQVTADYLDKAPWMLFNLNDDFSESTDVADKYPAKLAQLKQEWYIQASKYKVFPVDGTTTMRLMSPRPQLSPPRDKYVYYPGTGEVDAGRVDIRNRSHSITADVEIPKGGAQGVLLCDGGSFAGYSFFLNKDRKLQYSHNYCMIEEYKVISPTEVPDGKVTLRMEFEKTGPPDFKTGQGSPGTVRLFINGKAVAEGKIPVTVPIGYSLSGDGLSCGRDTLSAVSRDYAGSEFPFTGTIRRVVVDVGNDQHPAPKEKFRD
jgi:arylsulfatase A-like enzyme